mmetsp:Transcript_12435/g.18817  ORF Transcript_12435/g.18817 Transcript_12435/m.18817 type:complete len:158 (-) Transcript_12435:170-643(-)
MIKVNLNGGSSLEGSAVAVDPVSKVLVLENDDSFKLVFPGQVSSIDGDLQWSMPEDENAIALNVQALQKREQSSLESAEQSIAHINTGVSDKIQTLYDRLSFLFPCRWEGNDIVILDQCVVKPPYCAENIVPNDMCSSAGLTRITKVLQGERKKLGI